VAHAVATINGKETPVSAAIDNDTWIKGEFVEVLSPSSSLTFSPPPSPHSRFVFLSTGLFMCVCYQTIQTRGAAVIKARKLSSAMSAAKAICDHMRDWWFGTKEVWGCGLGGRG